MKKRIKELKTTISELETQYQQVEERWVAINIDAALKENLDIALRETLDQHRNTTIKANQKKLVNLNGGTIKHQRPSKGYINLTDKTLTPDQEELLNFGLNCHILSKPSKHQKRVECEILLDDVANLAKKGEVIVKPTFKQEIIAESSKTRGNFNSKLIEPRHTEAAKQLKADHNIIIRKADKSAAYVIMNKTEYLEKIDTILADERKFVKISKDPTEALKKKLNKFITMSNINSETIKINKVSGEYGMGYCYGTVKTHKPGNKLRPIISQILTPTYNIAKKLCKILTPYVPTTYSLNSATDFLDILKSNNSRGIIASLDVESLFTNVPVERTINYIAHYDNRPGRLAGPEQRHTLKNRLLEGRATFLPGQMPALHIRTVLAADQANYTCRVEFRI
ncbi:uncharacterized protein LOC126989158, partial [Eriocheir sinensis]|uniref:uncharacterized protein LOC126989158 n=1 Tax=Eriocheir sinensis TaxID=95602 RepID=UPI0021C9596E